MERSPSPHILTRAYWCLRWSRNRLSSMPMRARPVFLASLLRPGETASTITTARICTAADLRRRLRLDGNEDPKAEADLKGTIQYEKQQFISGTSTSNPNLSIHVRRDLCTPPETAGVYPGYCLYSAYNDMQAYSANETNTFSFPPISGSALSGNDGQLLERSSRVAAPTKRNSFQFTMGLTYAIKSKY